MSSALVVLAIAGVLNHAPAPKAELPKLECKLEAAEHLPAGEPVRLRFALRNLSGRRLYVLKWYTPLEGLRGKIFKVTRDGAELPYRGMMSKRGNPARSSYVAIAPGDSAQAEVDLARAYDFSAPGLYTIEFQSRIHDFTWNEKELPRPSETHRPCPLTCASLTLRIETE